MRVGLLYEQQEWKTDRSHYYDANSIVDDLDLGILFRSASREPNRQEGMVQKVIEADVFLERNLRQIMLVPLKTEEEIVYRQDILRDFCETDGMIQSLYQLAKDTIQRWEKLGKKEFEKNGYKDNKANMISKIRILTLFINQLSELKKQQRLYEESCHSAGLRLFREALFCDFSDDREVHVREVLQNVKFYSDGEEEYHADEIRVHTLSKPMMNVAEIVMQCQIGDGMKLSHLQLESVKTYEQKYKRRRLKPTMEQRLLGAMASARSTISKEDTIVDQMKQVEQQAVGYILSYLDSLLNDCKEFFEQLYVQSGFYMAAVNLYARCEILNLEVCFPSVCESENLRFENLIECSMALFNRSVPVGNSVNIKERMLLIVTGANQGGKSTFLRSIGIAQIMMQCGLFVTAKSFSSGIFTHYFTHFTRREDSSMNSGRLDEEMNRMNEIINHLGGDSIVLLNESFATTTEKEGSLIAYDIIRALTEAGVKVLTVTHLLSFAKRIYEEENEQAQFLSAERLDDGVRTFRMVQSEPELSSFGLDLYEQIIQVEEPHSF